MDYSWTQNTDTMCVGRDVPASNSLISRALLQIQPQPPKVARGLHTAEAGRRDHSLLTVHVADHNTSRSLRFNGRRQALMGCALPIVKPNAC
jgi:hypothetical protein